MNTRYVLVLAFASGMLLILILGYGNGGRVMDIADNNSYDNSDTNQTHSEPDGKSQDFQRKVAALHTNMTEKDVYALLGKPTRNVGSGIPIDEFILGDYRLYVSFLNGRVAGAYYLYGNQTEKHHIKIENPNPRNASSPKIK